MPTKLEKLGTGFFVVQLNGDFFDTAIHSGKVLLASSHSGSEIPWDALDAGSGNWQNASPFQFKSPPAEKPKAKPQDDSYNKAIALCDEIDSLVDEVPERGEEFSTSVQERTIDIRESIEECMRATDKQITALENMLSGLRRWVRWRR